MTTLWQSVKAPGSLTERIAAQIEELITSHRLAPGARLPPERELALQLRVSRPSVREAVKRLEARGLVRVKHGQGVFIEEPAVQRQMQAALRQQEVDIQQLFNMREVLELPAAAWAASRATPEDLKVLEKVLGQLEQVAATVPLDAAELKRLDMAFHLRVAEIGGNKFLQQTLGVLQQILSEGMQTTLLIPGRIEKSKRDHRAIFAALAAGDSKAARRAARGHIRGAQAAALRRIATAKGGADPART